MKLAFVHAYSLQEGYAQVEDSLPESNTTDSLEDQFPLPKTLIETESDQPADSLEDQFPVPDEITENDSGELNYQPKFQLISGMLETRSRANYYRDSWFIKPIEILKPHNEALLDFEWQLDLSPNFLFINRNIAYVGSQKKGFSQFYVAEAYLQGTSTNGIIGFDLGKLLLEWGDGYFQNPSAVLLSPYSMPAKNPSVVDELGTAMGQLRLDVFGWRWELVVAELKKKNLELPPKEIYGYQLAQRFSRSLGAVDLSLTHRQTRYFNHKYGMSVAATVGNSLVVYTELAATDQRDRLPPTTIRVPPPSNTEHIFAKSQPQTYAEYLVGGQYTFDNQMNFIVEYYQNGHGYNQQEAELLETGIKSATLNNRWQRPSPVGPNLPQIFLLTTQSQLAQRNYRQHYAFARLTTNQTENDWEVELIYIKNLDDQSNVARIEISKYNIHPLGIFGLVEETLYNQNWTITLSTQAIMGTKYSEFGSLQNKGSSALSLIYNF